MSSCSNRNTCASSSRAQEETGSSKRAPPNVPVPEGTPDGSHLLGEAIFEGWVIPGSYSSHGCRLEDERVRFQLTDGRKVGSESLAARDLKEMVGYWVEHAKYNVTLHGTSLFVKRVEIKVEIVGGDCEGFPGGDVEGLQF